MTTAKILASCFLGLWAAGSSASAILPSDACQGGAARTHSPFVSAAPVGRGTYWLAFDSGDSAASAESRPYDVDGSEEAHETDEPDPFGSGWDGHARKDRMNTRIMDKLTPKALEDMERRMEDPDDPADW